jgi:hypothetical protein
VRHRSLPVVVLVALLLAACGTTSPKADPKVPLPAGPLPSTISKMVCADEAQHDMAEVLGEKALVSTPTWVAHLYSCQYQYHTGEFGLSVKELSSWSQTKAYFRMLGRQLGDTRTIGNLGQGAFQTTDGSIVVRKDWKVLLVDISRLPNQFGVPPTSRAAVAVTVADVILGCWEGD